MYRCGLILVSTWLPTGKWLVAKSPNYPAKTGQPAENTLLGFWTIEEF
jgi:hypothetical protein